MGKEKKWGGQAIVEETIQRGAYGVLSCQGIERRSLLARMKVEIERAGVQVRPVLVWRNVQV